MIKKFLPKACGIPSIQAFIQILNNQGSKKKNGTFNCPVAVVTFNCHVAVKTLNCPVAVVTLYCPIVMKT